MRQLGRIVFAVVGVAAMAGCDGRSIPESRGDTTAPAPGPSVAATEVESLVVPMGQVPDVGDSLRQSTINEWPSATPPVGEGGPEPGSACMLAQLPGGIALFGDNTMAFRSVNYSGFSNVYVLQAVGVYADPSDASAVFQRLATGLAACKSQRGKIIVDSIAPAGVTWHEHKIW